MSRLVFAKSFPRRIAGRSLRQPVHRHLLIYDRRLDGFDGFREWRGSFSHRYPVRAGEALKSMAAFPKHMEQLLKHVSDATRANTTILAVGGGSVGDFAGFAASVMKRGVGLVHLPSTWLAALDSAHGGKTALNLGSVKNQIGTFYPADSTIVVRDLLASLPERELVWALGELFKISMIDSRRLFGRVASLPRWDESALWKVLPEAIEAKLKIVRRDPEENKGIRQLLNLGHTLGHALEAHHSIAHGHAVALGTRFAARWSLRKGLLSARDSGAIRVLFDRVPEFSVEQFQRSRKRPSAKRLSSLLRFDKKGVGRGSVQFVFPVGVGRVTLKRVTIESLVKQACRDGWANP